jgi:Ca-activated chloride channel family protein
MLVISLRPGVRSRVALLPAGLPSIISGIHLGDSDHLNARFCKNWKYLRSALPMNKYFRLIPGLMLAVIGFIIPTFAQPVGQPGQKPEQKPASSVQQEGQEPTPRIITINVRLPVTVMDESRRFVTDLKQEDFEILEDKVKQTIDSFQPLSNLPLDVAVLMDTSNSVKPKLKFEKEASVSFIETVLKLRGDRAMFVTFDSQVELHQDFTNRLDLLSTAINKVKAQGETRLFDAVYRVCEEKMFAQTGRRRVIVVISDGDDTASERSLKEAVDLAQRSETQIFVISTKAAGFFGTQAGTVDNKEDKNLKYLAEETGGRAFFTGNMLDLEKSFALIARELRSQYIIAYEPTSKSSDGKFRKIEVRLPGKKDMSVRTRKGYTALERNKVVN